MAVLTRGAYALAGTSLDFKTGSWRNDKPLHRHASAPCHGACLSGEDPQAWLAKIQEGDLRAAWEVLAAVNPLPATTGRVCPHPCETACNRGAFDQPIAIHAMERFLGDEALRQGWAFPEAAPDAQAGSIAVIGAGPAGLSAAFHARRRGHKVTLFEALPEAGGLLRSAIPLTRLPREVLDAEIERLLATGIDFQPRTRLGIDIHLDDLAQSFDSVFLAPGTAKAREWNVDGAVPDSLRSGLDLLQEWIALGRIPLPRSVAIHGGGNTAVDLARVMKRAGVAEVHLITASGLPGPEAEPGDILNVVPREFDQAVEEGVVFHPHRTLQRLILRGSKLVGVEMVHLRKLPKAGGGSARIPFEGTETVLHVEMVIPAIGETVEPLGLESLLAGRGFFRADGWGRLDGHPGILVGGDARGDRGTVAQAIQDGRLAARALAAHLTATEPTGAAPRPPIGFDALNTAFFDYADRAESPTLAAAARTDTVEIEGSLTRPQAVAEAARCFSCGNCLACDNCWTFCPDNAVIKTVERATDGSHYVFDYDYCKGCGLCARECPCGFIAMAPEE